MAALAEDGAFLVEGKVEGGERVIDREFFESLGTEKVVATTPYTEGAQLFRGVPLERLLQAIEAAGSEIEALSLNDHSVGFRIDEALINGAFIAFERDGDFLNAATNGPFWIVFPANHEDAQPSPSLLSMSIRQLARMRIR